MGQNLVEVFDGIYAFRNNAPKNTNGLILIHPFYEDHEYNPKYLGHLENLLKRVKIPVFTLTDGDIEEEAGRIAEMSNKKWKYFLKTVSG
ncbi:hypothetical protein GOV11_04480, partial [Candidatus Woesearchaeota archaeon]|nr:hypothetical protein [Candidatus Woesearchaeota archaeon]